MLELDSRHPKSPVLRIADKVIHLLLAFSDGEPHTHAALVWAPQVGDAAVQQVTSAGGEARAKPIPAHDAVNGKGCPGCQSKRGFKLRSSGTAGKLFAAVLGKQIRSNRHMFTALGGIWLLFIAALRSRTVSQDSVIVLAL